MLQNTESKPGVLSTSLFTYNAVAKINAVNKSSQVGTNASASSATPAMTMVSKPSNMATFSAKQMSFPSTSSQSSQITMSSSNSTYMPATPVSSFGRTANVSMAMSSQESSSSYMTGSSGRSNMGLGRFQMSALNHASKRSSVQMMAVAAGQQMEPTISGEPYTKMIENYMDKGAQGDNFNYHEMANAIRFLSMDAIEVANSGHPGLPMGMADVCTVLFKDFLKFNPEDPDWPDRDRFILSAGHGSMLIYSLLYLSGYKDIRLEDIKTFRQLGSRAAGHPENFEAKGIETTTGPLGQGIANAVGMAISEKMLNAKYGDDQVNHYTYALCGDGCLMEGISQEAITFAAHHKLNKLIYLWDNNEITIDGRTSVATSEDQMARFKAAGWHVEEVDGHNVSQIKAAIAKAKTTDMPSMIACKTTIGFGAPSKAGTNGVHGAALGAKEIEGTRANFKWDAKPFEIPSDIAKQWSATSDKSMAEYKAWNERLAKSGNNQEVQRVEKDQKLPDGWEKPLHEFLDEILKEKPGHASRKSSELVLNKLAEGIPELVGGSADLTGSNLTKATSQQSWNMEGSNTGNYIHYGIREHVMGAIMNGMALHKGMIPYGGTFLMFSDYCRHAIRMSALMKIRVVYVMTHDSIGLGEDGPTHQPIEHMASFRAVPNLYTMRPCDTVETAECWKISMETLTTPSLIALSRQGLPDLRDQYKENMCAKGGYVISEASAKAKVTLISTGSEVGIAVETQKKLEAAGIPTAVVSMPITELFDEQSKEYKDKTLGDGLRVSIEAASTYGWHKYTGQDGLNFGIDTFGVSSNITDAYEYFGLTADKMAPKIQAALK